MITNERTTPLSRLRRTRPCAGTRLGPTANGTVGLLLVAFFATSAAGATEGHLTLKDPAIRRINSGAGLEIYYRKLGNWSTGRVPLVTVPGLMQDALTYRKVNPHFAKTRPVLELDLPGFGRSGGRSTFSMRLRDDATVVATVCNQLGIREADLMGHSKGGGAVSGAAALHPDKLKVRELFLVAPVAMGKPHFEMPWKGRLMGLNGAWGELVSRLIFRRPVFVAHQKSSYLDPNNLDKQTLTRLLSYFRQPDSRRATRLAVISMKQDTGQTWEQEVLRKIKAQNASVFVGLYDRLITPHAGRLLAEIVGASYTEFTRSGHFPMVEQPREFIQAVERRLPAE